MAIRSLYDVLGVARTATAEEIKLAYKKQAMRWHPDRNLDNRIEAEERFKEIAYAYSVLSDGLKKGNYDDSLRQEQTNARHKSGSRGKTHEGAASGADRRTAGSESAGSGFSNNERAQDEGKAGFTYDKDFNPYQVFFEHMLSAARLFANAGYGEVEIVQLLVKEGCPSEMAMLLAKAVLQNIKPSRAESFVGELASNKTRSAKDDRTLFQKVNEEKNPLKILGMSILVCAFLIFLFH